MAKEAKERRREMKPRQPQEFMRTHETGILAPPNSQRTSMAALHYGIAASHVSPVTSKAPSGLPSGSESVAAATINFFHFLLKGII